MKAYYTASSKFKKSSYDIYLKTINSLEKENLKVSAFISAEEDIEEAFSQSFNEENFKKASLKQDNAIKNSSIVIADITQSTGAVGYHVAHALNLKKPVLILKQSQSSSNRVPGPIIGNKSRLIKYEEYDSVDQIEGIVKNFTKWAQQKLDTKFILILPPEIDQYITWAGEHRRRHKAQIVRESIENTMSKDKEYKEYKKITQEDI